MYSDPWRKRFVECARKMSPTSPAKFATANSSTSNCRSRSACLTSMTPAQLVGLRAELHRSCQHRVVAVPLHEIGASHEGAVLRGAAVVVPQIEVDEIDRLRERRGVQQTVLLERRDDVGRVLYLPVGAGH